MAIFSAISAAFVSLFAGNAFFAFVAKTLARMAVSAIVRKLTERDRGQVYGVSGKLEGGEEVPRQFPMGRAATGGSLVYGSFWGNDGVTNSYLTYVIALSDLPVKGLLEFWVDGVKCTIGTNVLPGEEDLGLPVAEYRVSGKNHAWVKFYDGTQTVADPLILGRGAHPDYPWSSSAVGTGIAYAIVTVRQNAELFSGFPRFLFVLDSVRLYDPSRDTSVGGSGSQRWNNPATWGGDGDDLPAVQAYNVMRGIRFNGKWIYGFQRLLAGQLPVSEWIAEINKCRVTARKADGSREPRFRAGGMFSVDAEVGDALEAIMSAAAGRIMEIGGIYKPQVGIRSAAVMALVDDDIVTTEGQQHSPFFGLSETINAIAAKYPEPDEGYALKDAPLLFNPAFEAQDQGRRLPNSITLPNVPYRDQVQRIIAIALEEARRQRRHVLVLPPKFYRLEPGDEIIWSSARHGYVNKPFRVSACDLRADCHLLVDLIEVDDSGVDYDEWTSYNPIVTAPIFPANPAPAILFNFTATAGSIRDSANVQRRPTIECAWISPGRGTFRGVEIQIALAAAPTAITKFFADADETSLRIASGIIAGENYLVRGAPLTNTRRQFGVWIPVTARDLRVTPSDLDQSINDAIAEGQAAFIEADSVRADHDALTAGFQGDLATAFAEQAARSMATTGGWLKDPTFTDWVSGNLNVANWASRSGTSAYATEGGGDFGGGMIVNAPSGSAQVDVIASNAANSGLIRADATADYVALEFDFEYISGDPNGVVARVEWSSNGTTWTRGTFKNVAQDLGLLGDDYGVTPAPGVRQSIRALWKRPAGVSGHIRLRFFGKLPAVTDPQSMVVHYLNLRRATQAEIDAGETYVIASATPGQTVAYAGAGAAIAGLNSAFSARTGGLEANVTRILGVRADLLAGTALASLFEQLQVNTSTGLSAWVATQSTAIASLQNKVSASYVLRVGAGGAEAGLEVVAQDSAVGGPASSVKIRADNIGLFGDVLVTAGNLWPDFDAQRPEMYTAPAGLTLTFGVSGTTAVWDGLGLKFLQAPVDASQRFYHGSWFRIDPGVEYLVQGKAGMQNSNSGGGTARLQFQTASEDKTVLSLTNVSVNTDIAVQNAAMGSVTVTPAATAVWGRFRFVRDAGGTVAARTGGWRVEKKAGADLIVDGSITAQKFVAGQIITGNMILDGAVSRTKVVSGSGTVSSTSSTSPTVLGTTTWSLTDFSFAELFYKGAVLVAAENPIKATILFRVNSVTGGVKARLRYNIQYRRSGFWYDFPLGTGFIGIEATKELPHDYVVICSNSLVLSGSKEAHEWTGLRVVAFTVNGSGYTGASVDIGLAEALVEQVNK